MSKKKVSLRDWLILIVLAVIWGTSFILIKRGVEGLSWDHVGAWRIAVSFLALSPLMWLFAKSVPRESFKYVVLVGILGSGIPPFLFAIGQLLIPSSIAGILNATTPVFVLVTGALFFRVPLVWFKALGVLLGLAGATLLVIRGIDDASPETWVYGLVIIGATLCYGLSVNVLKTYLQNVNAIAIGAFAFVVPGAFAIPYLLITGFPATVINDQQALEAAGFVAALGIFSTALASLLFFGLTQRTNALFASTVTYLIPLVALGWGAIDGEPIYITHVVGMGLILTGVYLASLRRKAVG